MPSTVTANIKLINLFSLLICIYNFTPCSSFPRNRYANTFRGGSISQNQLNKIRSFNQNIYNYVSPDENYNQVRKAMNQYGLTGTQVHVGHIIPNQKGTSRYNGPEDRARNLMAQPASDNIRLGNKKVSKTEMKYYGRN
jgi:hypothetical protein